MQIAVPALFLLIVFNAFYAARNLNRVRKSSGQQLNAAVLQTSIRAVLVDLGDMESGQRGYLLTNDDAYLKPYDAAKARLSTDFDTLRAKLTSPKEASLLDEVKSIAESKIGEAEKTIDYRQRGYRHRAFVMMDSGEGKRYMEEARSRLATLSAAAEKTVAELQRESDASLQQARTTKLLGNLALLALTAIVFVSFRWYSRKLEAEVAQRTAALRDANGKLDGVAATISQKVRELLGGLQGSADALLQGYGDFLPRQAQQHAEFIQGAAGETNQLIEELIEDTRLHHVA